MKRPTRLRFYSFEFAAAELSIVVVTTTGSDDGDCYYCDDVFDAPTTTMTGL